MSFHTFTLPEDRCARLLLKNLGRGTPESVVREELEALDIRVQGVRQLRSGRHDQDLAKDRPLTPTSLYPWRGGLRCPKCVLSLNSADCECRWRRTWLQRARCNANAASASDTHSETADTRPGESHVGAPTFPLGALSRGNSHNAAAAGAITQRVTETVSNGKNRGRPLQSERPKVFEIAPPMVFPLLLQVSGPSAEQMDLGDGWNNVVRGERVVKAAKTPPPFLKSSPQPATETPTQPKVTATRKTAGPKKP